MARDLRITDFRPNGPGIVSIWKGEGMQAALRELADEKAEEANASARLHGTPETPPYGGGVDVLDLTAVGFVTTRTELGRIDQKAHHTLDALNH